MSEYLEIAYHSQKLTSQAAVVGAEKSPGFPGTSKLTGGTYFRHLPCCFQVPPPILLASERTYSS